MMILILIAQKLKRKEFIKHIKNFLVRYHPHIVVGQNYLKVKIRKTIQELKIITMKILKLLLTKNYKNK
jgi:hypothetical protein